MKIFDVLRIWKFFLYGEGNQKGKVYNKYRIYW